MTGEPRRWRESGSDASPLARELLASARRPSPMSPAVRARTAARVAAIAATPVAAGFLAKWLTGKTIAWLAGFSLLGALIGVTLFLVQPKSQPPTVTTPSPTLTAQATQPTSPPTIAPPTSVTATIAPTVATASPPTVVAPKPSTSLDPLAREGALLESARKKLSTDPAAALAEANAHRAAFPGGQLAAEREYIAIDALNRLGRKAEAKARGEAFLAKNPTSLYADPIRKLIE